MTTENEIEIRNKMQEIQIEAQKILDNNQGDTIHHVSDRFFELVNELYHINSWRSSTIKDRVAAFVDYCNGRKDPEVRHKYEEIVKITQQFMDEIRI